MRCSKCGKEIANDSNFCEFCGTQIKPVYNKWMVFSILLGVVISVLIVSLSIAHQEKEDAQYEVSVVRSAQREAEQEVKRLEKESHELLTKLNNQIWVDMGLPSGTLWKKSNEEGNKRFAYNTAIKKYSNQLPTKSQFEELQNYCKWEWTSGGYRITGPNGNYIHLPAAGWRDASGTINSDGQNGWYCFINPSAGYLYLSKSEYRITSGTLIGTSVRLVKE